MAPTLHVAVPGPLHGHQRRSRRATSASSSRSCARSRCTALAYDAAGRSHRVTIGPLALFDLMLVTDYIPPLRAILPTAVRSALAGDGALLARLIRDVERASTTSARRATSRPPATRPSARPTPLPWDPGTPIDQRPAVVAAADRARCRRTRSRRSTRRSSSRTRSTSACAGRTSRAPPSTAAPLPYPTVPTLILQGGEDLRTPPEVSARVAARIPGSVRLVVPGVGHSTVSDPRDLRRRRDRAASSRGATLPKRLQADPDRHPGRRSAPPTSFDVADGVSAACRARSAARCARSAATLDDLRLVLSPAALTTSGGGLRGGSLGDPRQPARPASDYAGCQRGDRDAAAATSAAHAARRRLQGGARDGHAALGRAPVRHARRAPDLGASRRAATSARPRRPEALEVGALTYRHPVILPTACRRLRSRAAWRRTWSCGRVQARREAAVPACSSPRTTTACAR